MSTNAEKKDAIKLSPQPDLAADFPIPSAGEWRKEAEANLKDTTFEKALITRTFEGIDLQPIYTREDTATLPLQGEMPGFGEYLRGARAEGALATPWEIQQTTWEQLPEGFNERVLKDLERGQTAVRLNPDRATQLGQDPDEALPGDVGRDGVSLAFLSDLTAAMRGVDLAKTPVYIEAGCSNLPLLMGLVARLKQENADIVSVRGGVTADPLAWLAVNGETPIGLETAYDHMATAASWASRCAPRLKTIGVSALPHHNAGAHAAQELGCMLATAADYIQALLDRNLDIGAVAPQIRVTLGIGSFMFMEMAKIRAARILWSQLIRSFGGGDEARKINLHAVCSSYNQSKLDPWVNMLRTTTEAFSAIAAGVDSLETNACDETFGAPDEFSRRVARNTQIILREEAHMDQLIDPAGGSYFVEKLTAEIAEKAWKYFQRLMSNGGMARALQEGIPQRDIGETAQSREKDLAKRKFQMVGVNFSANVKETILEDKRPDYAALHAARRVLAAERRGEGDHERVNGLLAELGRPDAEDRIKTGAEALLAGASLGQLHKAPGRGEGLRCVPLRSRRLAEMYEELRLAVQRKEQATGEKPKVFLATMGPLKQHKPRADFSQGLFETAGLEVMVPPGFNTPEEAADAALASNAPMVAICSTDDTYPALVPPIIQRVRAQKPETVFVLAGFPKEQAEAHKESGIDAFIYMGCDVRQTLGDLLSKTGVTA